MSVRSVIPANFQSPDAFSSGFEYVMFCAIWYYLYKFKKREKHSWRSVILVKLQVVFQIVQMVPNCAKRFI